MRARVGGAFSFYLIKARDGLSRLRQNSVSVRRDRPAEEGAWENPAF